jgi:hypothetical protein
MCLNHLHRLPLILILLDINKHHITLEEYEIADTSLKGLYLYIREAAKRMIVSSTTQEQESKGNKIAVNNNTTYAIIIYRLLMIQFPDPKQMNILFQCLV